MESSNTLVLGIEGGGTKTEWVYLAPGGEAMTELKQGSLPAANLKLTTDEALLSIFQVLPADATHVGAFLAGCGTPEDATRLSRLVQARWPQAVISVGSDRESGFAAAFGDGDGIGVISGTGSAVTGRKDGQVEKAGGWGQLLGDRGGGYDLAVQGLRLALWNFDVRQRITPLAEEILQALALNRLEELVDWAKNADKMSVAKLAPVIFRAARNGDQEMNTAIAAGARALAEYTEAVARRLHLPEARVQVMGGIMLHNPEYLQHYQTSLAQRVPLATVGICERSGALGAAWLAARAEGAAEAPAKVVFAPDTNLDELAHALTEQRNPRSAQIDGLPTAEMVELFVSEEANVAEALAACRESLTMAVDLTAESLKNNGRLFYAGAGTSGRLGVLDASEIPPTFGAPPGMVQGIMAGGPQALFRAVEGAEDSREQGALTMLTRGVRSPDVVCGITASGRTPFVLGALGEARRAGARTILLTCNPARHRDLEKWDVEIDLPTGPELVTGSTRLKAGTATKVSLNIISTCAMIRLGKVKGNLMVDLSISNVKLRDRAIRLVSSVRGMAYAEARAELERHNWRLRDCLSEAVV